MNWIQEREYLKDKNAEYMKLDKKERIKWKAALKRTAIYKSYKANMELRLDKIRNIQQKFPNENIKQILDRVAKGERNEE